MARKKQLSAESKQLSEQVAPEASASAHPSAAASPTEAAASTKAMPDPAVDEPGDGQEQPKHWGDPYKAIFSCKEMGFELGEDRRFKQRVFKFADRPSDELLSQLKDNGFTYRAAEKSWTIPADAASRKLTDDLARDWAGPGYIKGMER